MDELRAALSELDSPERTRLLGKLLREARDTDVWRFVTPEQVTAALPVLGRHLGHRRRFWRVCDESMASARADQMS